MFRRFQLAARPVNLHKGAWSALSGWLWFVPLLSLLVGRGIASQAYDYKVIAKTGRAVGGFSVYSIKDNPTINDNGHIAFVASVLGGGEALVRWNGTQNELLSVAFSGNYGSASIDDSDRVATRFSTTSGGNSYSAIRRYSEPNSFLTLNEAGNAQAGGVFIWSYGSFLPEVAMSSVGTVLFGAVNHVGWTYLAVNNSAIEVHIPPFPVISRDSDRILVRPLAQANSPILLYRANNLGTPEATIASSGEFSKTGQKPGINDDATIVAFYGESTTWGGNGIYVRTKTPAGWV